MVKTILQSVGDDTIAFGDQCYWVADNVKKFMPNFQPGMEVEVTVKDINGTPMVTFLKKAGFAPAQGAPQQYGGAPRQQYSGAPRQQYNGAPKAPSTPAPASGGSDWGFYILASAIMSAYQLDANQVAEGARNLKKMVTQPPMPPVSQPMPPMAAPPAVSSEMLDPDSI